MPIQAKFTAMLQSLLIYTRQRFNLLRFALLALYLLLYAVGIEGIARLNPLVPLLVLALLFLFRLFDDLASQEIDQHKSDRIYTSAGPHQQLRLFLSISAALVLASLLVAHLPIGLLLLLFAGATMAAYKALHGVGNWRYLLPLLKYPVLCLLIVLSINEVSFLSPLEVLSALTLLPVFILFEVLDDEGYQLSLSNKMVALAAPQVVLLVFYMAPLHIWLVAISASAIIFLLLIQRIRIPFSGYFLLLYFLTFKLLLPYVV